MSTVLVAGGAGYIGSMVSRELLARGHRVVAADALLFGGEALLDLLSNPDFAFRKVDVRDPQDLEALFSGWRVDAVVHLAAIVGDPAVPAIPSCRRPQSRRLARLADSARPASRASCSRRPAATTARWPMPSWTRRAAPPGVALRRDQGRDGARAARPVRQALDFTPLRFATVFGVSPRMRFDLTVNEFAAMPAHGRAQGVRRAVLAALRPRTRRRPRGRHGARAGRGRVPGEVFNVGATDENYQKQQLVELIRPQPDAVVGVRAQGRGPARLPRRLLEDRRSARLRGNPERLAGHRRGGPSGVGADGSDWTEARYRN